MAASTAARDQCKLSLLSYYLPILVLAILAAIYRQLTGLLGRIHVNPAEITRWANSSALNNGRCEVNYAANACEDVRIHFASNTAFLACGDPVGRTQWYPPACVHDVSKRSEESFRESIFKYDIRSKRTTELRIEGLEGDFVTHGIDIYNFPDDSKKIHLFAVKHARDGDSIAIFSHVLGTDVLQLVRDVKHPNIKTANGVVATGPLEFYITNDHYFAKGWLRYLEEKYGPWTWATHVQHCNATAKDVTCRQVTRTFPGANGIARYQDQLSVGDSKTGDLTIFKILPDYSLEELRSLALGAAADNINVIPTTGDLVISIFPTLEDLPTYLANVHSLGKELRVPAAALRLRRENGYEKPELIYSDDGSVVSDMTAAAIDPFNNVFIGAAVLQYGGFAVCELEPTALS